MEDGAPATSSTDALQAAAILGRDTPAGRALYKLYGGCDVGRQKGQQHHERNKAVHEKKLAMGWTPGLLVEPPPPRVERPTVAVPSFGKKRIAMADRPKYIPHRRPGQMIQKEMAQEAERMREGRLPMPKGALLDEAEKERCSKLMEFRGKLPAAPPSKGLCRRKTEREELQELFDAVINEIEERREFLRQLEQHGALKREHIFQVRTEITERVAEMAKLDKMLKALDA